MCFTLCNRTPCLLRHKMSLPVRVRLNRFHCTGLHRFALYTDFFDYVCSFKPIIQYIDSQFERYLEDESGLNRRHIVDNRVHCCFYFINPSGHGYDIKHLTT